MIEITNVITNIVYLYPDTSISINKDIWDYAGIIGTAIAPVVAIVFTIWNNIQIKKIRSEDIQRELENLEKSEVRRHFYEINKFIDEQLYFLASMTASDFSNMVIKLQNLFGKIGMLSRSEKRDHTVYYIGMYIEIAYFLLSDFEKKELEEHIVAKRLFLNSLKEFDIFLLNEDVDSAQKRLEYYTEELRNLCKK